MSRWHAKAVAQLRLRSPTAICQPIFHQPLIFGPAGFKVTVACPDGYSREFLMTTHDRLQATLRTLIAPALCGVLLASMTVVAVAQTGGQQQQQPVTITKGTVEEIVRKGRATTLVIKSEAGGDPITVPITPRMEFVVEAKGDLEFLNEKQVVSGTGTLTNQSLFVKGWSVHVGLSAKKVRPFVKKAEKEIGQSTNSYDFAGTISSRQQDTDYPDYETVVTNISQLKGQPIYIDKGASVTVSMTETDLVKEGDNVEFVQQIIGGGRIQIVALRVLLGEPLKAEEFLKDDKSKTSRRSSGS